MSQLMNDTPMMRAQRAYDAACDAAQFRRSREEREFRASRGYGNFLNAAEYREMNRYLDRVMLDSQEMEAVQATRLALYRIGGVA
jgi:hypothetical protein